MSKREMIQNMDCEQLSLFSLMGEYETPIIQEEEQKKGLKGWIIKFSGIFLQKNGFKDDHRGVCTRPIIIEEDTKRDSDGRWRQYAKTTKGPAQGWYGGHEIIFAKRPSWNDCLIYAEKNRHKDDPINVKIL